MNNLLDQTSSIGTDNINKQNKGRKKHHHHRSVKGRKNKKYLQQK